MPRDQKQRAGNLLTYESRRHKSLVKWNGELAAILVAQGEKSHGWLEYAQEYKLGKKKPGNHTEASSEGTRSRLVSIAQRYLDEAKKEMLLRGKLRPALRKSRDRRSSK